MFLRRTLCFVLVWVMFLPCICVASGRETLDADLGKVFKNYKTVGGAVVVARGGQIVYERYYGYAHLRTRTEVTEKTAFRIASVTKMLSAIRVMQLVESGLLDLDTDLSQYLGYTIRNPYNKKPITLRMLMTHTSSLCSNGGYSRESAGLRHLISTDRSQVSNYYDEIPGSTYRYSNFGAGIMGSLIEAVTDENVNTSVRTHVFDPLGIDAAYSASLLTHPEDATTTYLRGGDTVVLSGAAAATDDFDLSVNPDMHYRITVGKIWIRPRDLCSMGILLCNGGRLNGVQLLEPGTVTEMMSDQNGKGGISISSPYGLCINRITNLLEDRMIYGHQGISDDIVANLYFDPQSDFVFALVTNGCVSDMDDRIVKLSRRAFALCWDAFGADTPIPTPTPAPGLLSEIPDTVTHEVLDLFLH